MIQKYKKKIVSIVIPVFNNLDFTKNCLESIYKHTPKHLIEIIVIDNASTDGTAEYLKIHSKQGLLKVINNDFNLGFGKACNQGATVSQGDYILFLNNDTIVTPKWIEPLLDCAKGNSQTSAVGGKLLYNDNSVQHCGVVLNDQKETSHIYKGFHREHPAVNKRRYFQVITAACMLIRKDIFFMAGMFDSEFKNGFEDVDLCLKLGQMKHLIQYCPGSEIYHFESKTPGRHDNDSHNSYYLANKQWYKHAVPDEMNYYRQDGIRLVPHKNAEGITKILMKDDNHNHFLAKAKMMNEKGQLTAAIDYFSKALLFNPRSLDNFHIMREIANIHIKMSNMQEAIKCLLTLTHSAPSKSDYLNLAWLFKQTGQYQEASLVLKKASLFS